jgi:hypothetical protein
VDVVLSEIRHELRGRRTGLDDEQQSSQPENEAGETTQALAHGGTSERSGNGVNRFGDLTVQLRGLQSLIRGSAAQNPESYARLSSERAGHAIFRRQARPRVEQE